MKKLNFLLLVALLHALVAHSTESGDSTKCSFNCCRPDALAPAGIMTDHVHEKRKFGIAYSYMSMVMQSNQSGTNAINNSQVFTNYLVAPDKMNMQMHMLMPMYGLTDRLTVMAMINYNINTMTMDIQPGANPADLPPCCRAAAIANANLPSKMKSSGLGDTKLYLIYNLLPSCNQRLVIGAGVSLPTGNIDTKGSTNQGSNAILAYNMQLGTGTYNLLPSLVYTAQLNHFTLGGAFQSNIKLGVNSHNYSWGNEYSLSTWAAYKITSWASFSLRGEAYYMNEMYGYDAAINQTASSDPTANVYNYGNRKVLNALAGINLYAPASFLHGIHLLVEYGMPVYQNLGGRSFPEGTFPQQEFQMPVKSTFTARLQYNF
jgi:hypothetical protein